MFSISFAPDTPDWLLSITLIISVGITFGMLIWGMIFEIRYTSPYTIINSSNKEKWRRAVILAFLQTGWMPLLGLAEPIISPSPDQWPIFPMFCSGFWIILFPITMLYKRWDFKRQIKNYQKIDKMIKDGKFRRIFESPFVKWTRIFMSSELKRFYMEGYSENTVRKDKISDD